MILTKNQKFVIGILHFLSIFGGIYLIIKIINAFSSLGTDGNPHFNALAENISSIFIVGTIVTVLSLFILIFDIIHLTRSNKNDKNNKVVLWILVLILFQGLSKLIYYFVEILPEKKIVQNDNVGNQ